ncbi:MAG: hypothetical protein EA397_15785 [Deltaproteobacteria bacterium]|nr:MAG: hypothetical protein EA397_15785 [Deltaproteobacteria bacterium]
MPTSDPALALFIERPFPFWRRRLLWIALLLAWVALALPIVGSELSGSKPPLLLLSGLACSGLLLLLLVAPVVFKSIRQIATSRTFQRQSKRAVQAMTAGDPHEAEVLLRAHLFVPHLLPHLRAAGIHNLGVCVMQQGNPERGRALMDHANASGWFKIYPLKRHLVAFAQGRALASVLAGDMNRATSELSHLSAREVPSTLRPFLDHTQMLFALRRGESAEAARIGANLDLSTLPPRSQKLVSSLMALALLEAGESVDRAQVAPLCAEDIPFAQSWPELLSRLERHGLLTPGTEGPSL